jgi:hypothetical protein
MWGTVMVLSGLVLVGSVVLLFMLLGFGRDGRMAKTDQGSMDKPPLARAVQCPTAQTYVSWRQSSRERPFVPRLASRASSVNLGPGSPGLR